MPGRTRTAALAFSIALFCSAAPWAYGCGNSEDVAASDDADLAAGEQTYLDYCGSCHGRDFEGSAGGPSQLDAVFAPDVTTDEDFRLAITQGAPKQNYDFTPMPAIGSLDDTEVDNVIAYVRSVQEERGFND